MGSSIAGSLHIELTSADVEAMLAGLSNLGVTFYHILHTDSLTVRLEISRSDLKTVKIYTSKHSCSMKVIRKNGLFWSVRQFTKRPLLIAGLAVILLLVSWLPTRVFFITVEGNDTIPVRHIIEQANLCGISFGASRREVRSEKMKNSLLAAIPSLQWAGINTSGCTATISVKERTQSEPEKQITGVSSIVASCDGVIESCTSEKGNLLCRTGQVVRQGDVLISGYTDCGITITATRARGEIFAQTRHELAVFSPTDYAKKGELVTVKKKYGLLIGKKRINFYKGSGIPDAGCDKICSEYYLTLPGGFQLPIALFVTITNEYDQSVASASAEYAEAAASTFAQQYLLSQMISGRIMRSFTNIELRDGVCVLLGQYVCSEMIGRVQNEEIIGNYGENN